MPVNGGCQEQQMLLYLLMATLTLSLCLSQTENLSAKPKQMALHPALYAGHLRPILTDKVLRKMHPQGGDRQGQYRTKLGRRICLYAVRIRCKTGQKPVEDYAHQGNFHAQSSLLILLPLSYRNYRLINAPSFPPSLISRSQI